MNGFLRTVFGWKAHPARRKSARTNFLCVQARMEALEERVVLDGSAYLATFEGAPTLCVVGTQFNDQAYVSRANDAYGVPKLWARIITNGRETVKTFNPADVRQIAFWGYGGNDDFRGVPQGYPTRQFGGEGNDTLIGGTGYDVLYGHGGNDRLEGRSSGDWLDGGNGNDLVAGEEGNDTLLGREGHDTLGGSADNDQIWGEGGNDSIEGGWGNDTLYGGSGNDTLAGHQGNDVLSGEDGNDFLAGGRDEWDSVWGGLGSDSFDYPETVSGYNVAGWRDARDFNTSAGDRYW